MSASDTPRTDAIYKESSHCFQNQEMVFASFARHLERELAAAIASFSEERDRAQREGERVIAAIEQRDKARDDALEQAAKVRDEVKKEYREDFHRWLPEHCANLIRAMKKVEK